MGKIKFGNLKENITFLNLQAHSPSNWGREAPEPEKREKSSSGKDRWEILGCTNLECFWYVRSESKSYDSLNSMKLEWFFLSFQKDIKVLAILALLIYTEIHIVKKQVVGICKKWE